MFGVFIRMDADVPSSKVARRFAWQPDVARSQGASCSPKALARWFAPLSFATASDAVHAVAVPEVLRPESIPRGPTTVASLAFLPLPPRMVSSSVSGALRTAIPPLRGGTIRLGSSMTSKRDRAMEVRMRRSNIEVGQAEAWVVFRSSPPVAASAVAATGRSA